jgi:hypothetical protein
MQETFESIINSSNPDVLLETLIISDLKTHSKYDPFDSQHEVKILLNYYKDALSHSKSSLCLSPAKSLEFLQLANRLIVQGTIKKPRKSIDSLKFEFLPLKSSFNSSDVSSIESYFIESYFQNLRLYNFIFSSRENTETAHISALIDEPLSTVPLSKSVQRVKNRLPIEDTQDLRTTQPSRTKLSNKRNAESKDHLLEAQLDENDENVEVVDPLIDTFNKFHGDLEIEMTRHEHNIEQEIEELKKRYR